MPRPRESGRRTPGVSYDAEGPVYELFITVRSSHAGTTVDLTYTERSRGDKPQQGRRWRLRAENPKRAVTLAHLSSLAGWATRRALSGQWDKVR